MTELLHHFHSLGKVWDVCVLTATNASQKTVYQLQLDRLLRVGFLHPGTEYRVISDPEGKRLGSGGATLHALREMERGEWRGENGEGGAGNGKTGWDSRVLILHSGGDSRRIPHQSILGKVFAALPPPFYSVFEALYPLLTTLGAHLEAGVVVASGDVLLMGVDPQELALPKGSEVLGLASWVSPELGERHGVYEADPQTGRILRCLQKQPAKRLREASVGNAQGQVALDTGVLLFQPAAGERLLTLAHQVPPDAYIDLYGEMLPALAAETDAPTFSVENRPIRTLLWDLLHPLRFGLWDPPDLQFMHTGTTQEYLELVQQLETQTRDMECEPPPFSLFSSPFSVLPSPFLISDGVVHCPVPLEEGWVHLIYGVSDVPTLVGEQATLFGRPLQPWLEQHHLAPEVIWPGVGPAQRCLWNAHLYPVHTCAEAASSDPSWFPEPSPEWVDSDRLSMAEIMRRADRVQAFAQGQRREAARIAGEVLRIVEVEEDTDVRPLFRPVLTPYGHAAARVVLEEALAQTENPLHSARLHKIAADLGMPFTENGPSTAGIVSLTGELDPARRTAHHEAQAFEAVRRAVAASIEVPDPPVGPSPPSPFPASGDLPPAVTIRLPVRVDLAGGWTDTPPYSLEKGGAVLNAAVLLNGRHPIEATACWIDEPLIRLKSLDQGQEAEIRDLAALQDYAHLNDPLALHRAVLITSGLFGEVRQSQENGAPGLEPPFSPSIFHSPFSNLPSPGLELTSSCNVPLGSGLGTSSILAAGLVMVVWRLRGVEWTEEQLFNQVLYIEQMLTAGGGWQDQVGGVVPGFKFTTTQPGMPQRFQVERLELSSATQQELADRMLLVYTGQQRVAKNILQLVVADWLSRRAELVATLAQLREDAFAMREALTEGDIETFGDLLRRYWEGKKVLNVNTTNATIDSLLERVADSCLGYGIAGAGGGGFLVLLGKDISRREQIERRLQSTSAVVYPWELAAGGAGG